MEEFLKKKEERRYEYFSGLMEEVIERYGEITEENIEKVALERVKKGDQEMINYLKEKGFEDYLKIVEVEKRVDKFSRKCDIVCGLTKTIGALVLIPYLAINLITGVGSASINQLKDESLYLYYNVLRRADTKYKELAALEVFLENKGGIYAEIAKCIVEHEEVIHKYGDLGRKGGEWFADRY